MAPLSLVDEQTYCQTDRELRWAHRADAQRTAESQVRELTTSISFTVLGTESVRLGRSLKA